MKQMKKLLVIPIILIALTGCGSKEVTCTRSTNQTNLTMDVRYDVKYKGKYVTNEKRTEVLKTDDESIIKAYKAQLENIFENYKDLKYYETSIKVKDNTLTAYTDINYSKVDMKKLKKIDQTVTDEKIKLNDLLDAYKKLGFTCNK